MKSRVALTLTLTRAKKDAFAVKESATGLTLLLWTRIPFVPRVMRHCPELVHGSQRISSRRSEYILKNTYTDTVVLLVAIPLLLLRLVVLSLLLGILLLLLLLLLLLMLLLLL